MLRIILESTSHFLDMRNGKKKKDSVKETRQSPESETAQVGCRGEGGQAVSTEELPS